MSAYCAPGALPQVLADIGRPPTHGIHCANEVLLGYAQCRCPPSDVEGFAQVDDVFSAQGLPRGFLEHVRLAKGDRFRIPGPDLLPGQ